jgi:hypothetical protein
LIHRYYIENSLTAEALLAQQIKPAKQRKHLLRGGDRRIGSHRIKEIY